MDPREQRRIDELETLAGQRAKGRAKMAIRIEDLQPLLELPINLQSTTVGAAPTQAQHNALVADVKNVYNRLFEVQNLIRKKLLNQA